MKVYSAAWKLAAFSVAMIVILATIVGAIQRAPSGPVQHHTALFTDANGLKSGDDVRMFGVAVGKVAAVGLRGNDAAVELRVQQGHAIYTNSTLAIRYQTLTGQRYVDIQQSPQPGGELAAGATIGTDRTVPSFDITTLFNGLQPVLAELSPAALNQFTESLLAVIEGNGSGIGPALDAIGKLGRHVSDRQVVISALMRNLAEISDKIGGRSPHLVVLLARIADVFTSLEQKIAGLVDFALTAPPVLAPLDSLLATFGLTPNTNPDIDTLVRKAFPDPGEAVELLQKIPSVLAALNTAIPSSTSVPRTCSRGAADDVPPVLQVLVDGQKVTICK